MRHVHPGLREIEVFLKSYCSELLLHYGFTIVDSATASSFGNAAIRITNEELLLRFIKDKGQLFLDFHSCYDKEDSWYSFDLIRQLLTGEQDYRSIMDEENGHFIRNNVGKILSLFDERNVIETLKSLETLEKKREISLWGDTPGFSSNQ